jgi:hypothetical protein
MLGQPYHKSVVGPANLLVQHHGFQRIFFCSHYDTKWMASLRRLKGHSYLSAECSLDMLIWIGAGGALKDFI